MIDPQFKAQLDTLTAFPQKLRQLLNGLSDANIRFRPAEGEWSIVEILGHMLDVETLQAARISQIISRDNPTLAVVDLQAMIIQHDYQNKQALSLANTFAEKRAATIEEWRYIHPNNLSRSGTHPTRGPLTIVEIIAMLARHDSSHYDQIATRIEEFKQNK